MNVNASTAGNFSRCKYYTKSQKPVYWRENYLCSLQVLQFPIQFKDVYVILFADSELAI